MRVAGGHQATLTLNFMDGTPAYAGEVRNSDGHAHGEAQQSAAEQALIAIEPVLALVPETKGVKRKLEPGAPAATASSCLCS